MKEGNNQTTDNSDKIQKFGFEKITRDGKQKGFEFVAVERSYDLIVNGKRVALMTASPGDLKELTYGHLISEGIVKSKDQILAFETEDGNLQVTIGDDEKIDWLELGSSELLETNHNYGEEKVFVEPKFKIGSDLIFQILENLDTSLYQMTSGSHSASLINKHGKTLARSVDVGRHNSFDKVIGKGIIQDIDMSKTLLLTSGRQSAKMVTKAARVGIPIIVTKAAPLSSGIEAAEKTNLTLVCFADDEKFSVFTGFQNIEYE